MRAKAFFLIALLTITIFPLQAFPDDCEKARRLYNKAMESDGLKEQERLYKEAISIPCDNNAYRAFFHNNLADTYEKGKRYRDAETEYRKAVELHPEFLIPYISLGDLYAKMGRTKDSDAYYGHYLQRYFLKIIRRICALQVTDENIRTLKVIPTLTIYFDSNDVALSKEAQRRLEEFYADIKRDECTTYKLQIIGHKGPAGKGDDNQRSSEKGAGAVKRWLVEQGHTPESIQVSIFENNGPVVKNSRDKGDVEITIMGYIVKDIVSRPKWKEGIDLIEQGDRHSSMEEYNEAASCFEKAQILFKQEDLRVGRAAALGSLYLAYLELEDGEKAFESLNAFKAAMGNLPFDCSGGRDQ